ncbi:MAG: IS66 family transposase [Alphaproteobacteria bacterium]|nr:IS66 family transposase [Alphaproteobacteria bacterium]
MAEPLPNDIDALKRIIAERDAELTAAKAGLVTKSLEVEKLKIQIARLKRMTFGKSSERMVRELEQLELKLEELETEEAAAPPPSPRGSSEENARGHTPAKPRRQLPDHLPRRTKIHEVAHECQHCGGAMRKVGEDVTEVLEYIPGRFEVIRHVRPAMSCRQCEAMAQAPMPPLPIPRGMAGPRLLAHVLISKFSDHLPLYRQAEIYARDGVDLDRSLLADWVGKASWLVEPLVDRIAAHVMSGNVIHADDTPVPVLAPGSGKTKTGRYWVYLRDERPHCPAPPAALYRYAPDRKGERCRQHLKDFSGHLHADGYAGFQELYAARGGRPAAVMEVACWAHVRRQFHDVHKATGAPIAVEALERIGALFAVEREIKGKPPDERAAIRAKCTRPLIEALGSWFDVTLPKISGRSELAGAIRYARSRWPALTRLIDDGRLEISNNAVENAIRPLALGRKNYLFAGSDAGGQRAANVYTLIRTAELNGLEPEAYLADVLARIGEHPINRVDELLPWAWAEREGVAKLAA